MPWLEFALALCLAAGCTWAAWRAGRSAGRMWAVIFTAGGVLIAIVALTGHVESLSALPLLAWVQAGRGHHWLLAAGIPAVLFAPCPRLPRRIEQGLVLGGGLGAVTVLGVGPFLLPAALQGVHHRLPTTFDEHGVCRQPTPYTCGPAAGVTALRRLGIEEDLGGLTVDARTSPMFGTGPLTLCQALEDRHRAQGIRCRRTRYTSVEGLSEPGVHVIELQLDSVTDHWAVVDGRGADGIRLGDPLVGRRVVSPGELARQWRARGIVVWREGGS